MTDSPGSCPWKCEQLKRNSFRIDILYRQNKSWSQRVLLTSDRHWDNPKSDWDLQIKHLKESQQYQAPIIDAGDFFCAMQGKYDKRSSKEAVREIHNVDKYLNALTSTGADFFENYAKQFCVVATGNHEDSIEQHHGYNLIDELCTRLNDRTGSNIYSGGFSGWVVFSFLTKPRKEGGGSTSLSSVLHYDHGYGGGGPVTADMIQHQRRSVYLPDADIIISGHTHDHWIREIARLRLDKRSGHIFHDIQTHIKLPSYKDDYGDGYKGWAATRGMPPKPAGAVWLIFRWDSSKKRIVYDVVKAS